jgi:hypothetical protein
MMGDEEKGFTIVDESGSSDAETESAPDETAAPPIGAEQPPVDLSNFCLSLATSALYHMGVAPHPQSGEVPEKNLPLARHTIDTLEMLQHKTRGNLDEEEARLLESLLYELRMRFVEAGSGSSD